MPEQKGLILRRRTSTSSYNDDWLGRAANAWKNKVVAMDPANSTLCNLSDPLVVRFCIFSDSALENIGILTNKEVVEMQTDTATALADKLAAVNNFGKVDRHVFRADNTMSVTAQRTITRKVMLLYGGGLYSMNSIIASRRAQLWLSFTRIFESITKDTNRKHRLCSERGSAVDKVTGKHIYKTCNRVYALTAKTLSL
ncbi:hypothetical protein HBI59_251410 [Parastagonospora nodorum]|nr:hypothetical protein HBI59_251410 [Parastagonospora nodorum]